VNMLFGYHWFTSYPAVDTFEMVVSVQLEAGEFDVARYLYNRSLQIGHLPSIELTKRMRSFKLIK
jgi:hypothetical protein